MSKSSVAASTRLAKAGKAAKAAKPILPTKPVAAHPTFTHRNLPLLLLQAREGVLRRFRPLLNAHGLTEQQWRVIRVLHDHGPLEPRHIGEHCAISSPSMAGVLARMEALHLVKRQRVAHDQRRVLVQLTATSLQHVQRLAPLISNTYRDIEAALGPTLAKDLQAVLDRVVAKLGPPNAADPNIAKRSTP
jgi:homoprotocatechuate degradation regulator HpaR